MGLAPMIVAKIFEILAAINAQGTTILLVEQNAAQALRVAARGYVLETGSVALSDRAETLLADDRVRSAYLGESA
jgi:branched-chain amino acid transport system ATP-binding protein